MNDAYKKLKCIKNEIDRIETNYIEEGIATDIVKGFGKVASTSIKFALNLFMAIGKGIFSLFLRKMGINLEKIQGFLNEHLNSFKNDYSAFEMLLHKKSPAGTEVNKFLKICINHPEYIPNIVNNTIRDIQLNVNNSSELGKTKTKINNFFEGMGYFESNAGELSLDEIKILMFSTGVFFQQISYISYTSVIKTPNIKNEIITKIDRIFAMYLRKEMFDPSTFDKDLANKTNEAYSIVTQKYWPILMRFTPSTHPMLTCLFFGKLLCLAGNRLSKG